MRPPSPPLDPRTLPWLLATAVVTLAPHAAYAPLWLSGLACTLLLWRTWSWWRQRPAAPRWLLILLVVGATAGILFEYRTLLGQSAGVAMLLVFMALKLLELRSVRDATVVVMLGYFLLLTHYFNADSIPVAAWMLAALTVCIATLIQLQAPNAETVQATLRRAALLVGQSLPLMAILFLLFPRISGPLWGLPQDSRTAITGLTDRMSPGSISQLTQSTAIAFRATFPAGVPARDSLYWRGPVLMDYDGETWTPARGYLPPLRKGAITAEAPGVAYAITLEAHHQRWLLTLDMPVQWSADAVLSPTYTAVQRRPVTERLRFDAVSALRYSAGVTESREVLDRALALPENRNPRARALAASWRTNASTPPAIVVARALRHFREEGFVYTLNPPLLGTHAIDDFLFDARSGYCEHYAAAFVFLMRAAGVPARVVGGYQGGEINPVDGFLVVRQSDAHAWAEVWQADRGWVRVDPTAAVAPGRVEQGVAAALPASEALPVLVRGNLDWLRHLSQRWEALNNAWNQWVLGYNALHQKNLMSFFGLSADWRSLVATLAALSGLTLLSLLAWSLHRQRSRDPVLGCWQKFCRRMARHGIVRHPWEGPLDYTERVAHALPLQAPVIRAIGAAYIQLRYAQPTAGDRKHLLAQLRRHLRTLSHR